MEARNCWPAIELAPTRDQARVNRLNAARELQQLVRAEEIPDAPALRLAWSARGAMNEVTPGVALGAALDLPATRRGIARAIATLIALDQVLVNQARG